MVNALDTKEKVMNVIKDVETHWDKVAKSLLLNKKIVDVRYLTQEEVDDLGWYEWVVAFQTDYGFSQAVMMREMMGVRCLPLMIKRVAYP